MRVRTWLWIAFAASLVAGGVKAGYWLNDNINQKEIAQLQSGWDKERAELQKKYAEAEHRNREIEHDRDVAVGKVRDAYTKKRVEMERRHAGTVNRLHAALNQACPASAASSVPASTGSASGGHGAANGDGLRVRIAQSLARRIVVPADLQAQQLLGCQAYVKALLPDEGLR